MPLCTMIRGTRYGSAFAFFALLALASCGGGGKVQTNTGVVTYASPTQPPIGTIADVVAAAEAEPYLAGSTVMHYCDCQTGNAIQPAPGCTPGSDAGDGSAANPFQTLGYLAFDQTATYADGDRVSFGGGDYVSLADNNIGHYPDGQGADWTYINAASPAVAAATWLNSRTTGTNTVALCRGGVWNAPAQQYSVNLSGNTYCPAGRTCSEFREYTASWGGSGAKPVIYGDNAPSRYLFFLGNGQRVMNVELVGSGTGTTNQWAFFLYKWVPSGTNPGVHDDTIWNVDMDGFDLAVHVATAQSTNVTIQGNHITDSTAMAFLGSCSNLNLNYNYFLNNGSSTMFDHTVYFGSHIPVNGVNAIGNYIEGFSTAMTSTCLGGPFVMHGEFSNVVVSGNTIIDDPAKSGPGCWGLSANNGGYAVGTYLRGALFSNNIIVNGGNTAMTIDNCPGCTIENNLIIQDSSNGGYGIAAPGFGARRILSATSSPACNTADADLGTVCEDDPTTNYTIRNNTVYFTSNAANGMQAGIYLGAQASTEPQAGHRIYNNTVTYAATAHGLNMVNCFGYPLPLSAYSLIDNNNCYSADPSYHWMGTIGPGPTYAVTAYSPAEWISHSGFDTVNSAATATADPGFTLSAYPYITWTDSSFAYALFSNGTTNIFAPGASLLGKGRSGPLLDITGATRPDPPAIGAYQQ